MRLIWIFVVVGLAACSPKKEPGTAVNPGSAGKTAAESGDEAGTPAGTESNTASLDAVDSVSISPSGPKRGEALFAKVSDAHKRILYFAWLVDGQEVTGQHSDRLPGEFVVKGGRIAVRVTPKTDGDDGANKSSDEIVVGNTPPRIASIDLVSSKDNQVVLQARLEDVDGDNLTLRLVSAPPGMNISPSGEITWTAPADFAESITFAVGASDGDQEYILNSSVGSK